MKDKLMSRKFLSALAGALIGLATILNGDATQGASIVIASIVAYCMAEGYIDAKAVGTVIEVADRVDDLLVDKTLEESEDK